MWHGRRPQLLNDYDRGVRIAVVAGGVGSARLLSGVVRVVDPSRLSVIVNVGDDERIRGLHLSPDVDTVLYHLAGAEDWDRGWGTAGDTFGSQERYVQLASRLADEGIDLQEWLALGDLDLATNLLRTRLLDAGLPLSKAVDALRRAMGVGCRVLPATDDATRTVLVTARGDELAFQEWFVKLRQQPEVAAVRYSGTDAARPAPGVLEAIAEADIVVVPPSNPVLSVGPVLAVGVREALAEARAPVVAVSPIIGGRAVKGPADRLMAALGHEPTAMGVARMYTGVVDVFVHDDADAAGMGGLADLGMTGFACDTLMRSPEDAARLAKTVLDRA